MEYILSQILVIFAFVFLSVTYIVKSRKLILIYSMISAVFFMGSYFFLNAWSGLAMSAISFSRSGLFLINKNNNENKIMLYDSIVFIVSILLLFVCAIITFNGFMSLFSIFAETLYAISVFQKSDKVYKIIGLTSSLFWMIYNIFIRSIFGIFLQCILAIVEIIGVIRCFKKSEIKEFDKA